MMSFRSKNCTNTGNTVTYAASPARVPIISCILQARYVYHLTATLAGLFFPSLYLTILRILKNQ